MGWMLSITNQPRFLTTLKITILLCSKDRINNKTSGSLFCNGRVQGFLPSCSHSGSMENVPLT